MIENKIYKDYFQRLLKGDRHGCLQLVSKLINDEESIFSVYQHLFTRSMYEVGKLWETKEISVAVEHLASTTTEYVMARLQHKIFDHPISNKKAVVACCANEYHQIGGMMAADIFEMKGWNSYFLGANTPVEDLINMLNDIKPDILGLSLTISEHAENFKEYLTKIRKNDPDIIILIGGQAFQHYDPHKLISEFSVQYLENVDSLDGYLN